MAPKPQPAWSIYEEQMDFLCFGHALWEPSPTSRYTRISVGDVGFIRRGQFHFLFSAGTPLEERTRGEDVPATFEPLDVEATESRPPRQPGCLRTSTVRQIRTSTCATAPTPTPARESAANFSYELTETHGAALVTKYATYRSDAQTELAFEGYTKRHYDSWVKFVRDKQYGKDIQPILVTGFDVTKDFAMVAYLDDGTSLGAELTIDVPALASASTSLWGTWFTRCSPHTNQGPHLPMTIEFTPSQPAAAGGIPREFNQCVFIRYFTMRKRLWFFPKVIRAGAGPHDLGSGDNTGDTFPEVMAQSDSEPTISGDGDPRGPSGSTADDNGSEKNIDIQDTPHDGGYNSWDIIANYVFQNSDAASVLLHHRDLAGILKAGGAEDLPALLARHRPNIVVDESGVGRIAFQEIQQPVHPALQQIHCLDRSSPEFHIQLDDALHGEEYEQCVAELENSDLVWLINYLDNTLDGIDPSCAASRKCLRELKTICGSNSILPTSYTISSELESIDSYPYASGGFGDVYEGVLDNSPVCIKRLRVASRQALPMVNKMLCEEAVMWKHLKHPNILPLLGVTVSPPQLISNWIPAGDISVYMETHPDADRVGIIHDIAKGLNYLHSRNIVHGDLKGRNVLVDVVDDTPQGRLVDFGITIVSRNPNSRRPPTRQAAHNPLWSAPEVLRGENPSKESDIYSFAMTMIEVFTDEVPFSDRSEYMAVFAVLNGERPPRPAHATCTDELWTLMERCWEDESYLRPEVAEVLKIVSSSASPI